MAAKHPDFPQIQRRLRALGYYPQAPYAIDDEWGAGMSEGIDKVLDMVEKAKGIEPPPMPRWPALPDNYTWLRAEPSLPRHLVAALDLLGTKELAGGANSPTIMAWTKELADAGFPVAGYSADSVPWCGLFIAVCMVRAQRTPVDQPLWALNWAKFGEPGGQPELGDILTFKREGGGHVAIYIGEDTQGTFHILGGNQGDQVSIMRISKARMYSCRQPPYKNRPANIRPVILSASGVISHNEA